MVMLLALGACKKEENAAAPALTAQDVFITSVQAQRINMVYKLSRLGYKETGVIYYAKDQPSEQHKVPAIRRNEQFELSLQNLKPNSEYSFKIYITTNEAVKNEDKEYGFKTLSDKSLKFNLQINSSEVVLQGGKFSIDLEGDYLNELNLSELQIRVNNQAATVSYPVRMEGHRYKLTISGLSQGDVAGHLITASYREETLLEHYIPVKNTVGRYLLAAKKVNLPPGWYSVYKDNLYSFFQGKVLRWDPAAHRMVTVRTFEDGYVWDNTPCFEFDNQMFFVPSSKAIYPDPNDLSKYQQFLNIISYSPETNSFQEYPLLDRMYGEADLTIETSQFFIHKSELYLAFTLVDLSGQYTNRPITRTNFIYKYNKSGKRFDPLSGFKTDIISYHFTSINNQIYLIGLVPVTDQGFQLAATFGAFKVSDTFGVQPIYTAGTLTKAVKFPLKGIAKVNDKILIVSAPGDFKVFDPITRTLHEVYVNPGMSGYYYSGLFTYKNVLHINTDAGFTSQAIYELSISKENN